jgi:hypothetical protein
MPTGATSRRGRLAAAGGGGGKAQQVLRRGRIEPDGRGPATRAPAARVAVASLLQPQVVLDADAREHRRLFAAQARSPPHAHDAQPRISGVHEFAARPQIPA